MRVPLLFTLPAAIAADVRSASVLCTPGQASCVVQPYHFSAWTARAIVNNTMNTTGWGTLSVETATGAADSDAAFAAGYVEGAITPDLIDMQWQNMGPKPYPSAKAVSFIEQNNQYVKEQVAAHGGTDIYWAGVGLVYDQLAGMAAGYEAERAGLNALPRLGMQLLGMVTELEDIQKAVEPSARPDFSGMTPAQLDRYVFAHSHCSAMIKVTADLSELYSCHNTWTSYSSMLRLFKTYTFPFKASAGGATTVLFSGYPGSIAGVDDFYTTDRQLAVIETTNSVFNGSLYDLVTPRSVPYWARVTVATRGASTGKQWHAAFYRENSGTYNNQWMTVDYKLFTPREPLKKGLLLVSEQLPGGLFHAAEDQTEVLQRGHWPSYNVPFYPDVYQASGYPAVVRAKGPSQSYQLAPRAPIFRRDADRGQDLGAVQHFMRENRWDANATAASADPLFPGPVSAIAARADLDASDPRSGGAIDCKIVSAGMMKAVPMQVRAVAGPTSTATGDDQPPFDWAPLPWANQTKYPHWGQPTRFEFDWVTMHA